MKVVDNSDPKHRAIYQACKSLIKTLERPSAGLEFWNDDAERVLVQLRELIAEAPVERKAMCACCGCHQRNEADTWFICGCSWGGESSSMLLGNKCLKHQDQPVILEKKA